MQSALRWHPSPCTNCLVTSIIMMILVDLVSRRTIYYRLIGAVRPWTVNQSSVISLYIAWWAAIRKCCPLADNVRLSSCVVVNPSILLVLTSFNRAVSSHGCSVHAHWFMISFFLAHFKCYKTVLTTSFTFRSCCFQFVQHHSMIKKTFLR